MRRLFTVLVLCTPACAWGQVKMGHDAGVAAHPSAHLELANNTTANPGTWQGLGLPRVDFTNAAFTDSATWGIAGTPADGALVFNTGNRTTGGFKGEGTYVWSNGAWLYMKSQRCKDPGMTFGSTGCVSFIYRGQPVTYPTVRAKDGNIWLQQNLGADKVAASADDAAAYGHYFQWGRWDDGHQLPTSATASTTTLSANDPSGIAAGEPSFFADAPYWWIAGVATDTWSDATPSATNGKDPCAALGPDWHMPTNVEWLNVISSETIVGVPTALSSNLKLPAPGRRAPTGALLQQGTNGYYWTGSARGPLGSNGAADFARIQPGTGGGSIPSTGFDRANGLPVRCVKN
jgi:hypothetical protein